MNVSFFPANVTGAYLEAEVHPNGVDQFDADYLQTIWGAASYWPRISTANQ